MTRQRLIAVLLAAPLLSALNGCTVGPNYKKPALQAPGAFEEKVADTSSMTAAPDKWWEIFADPTLNAFEEKALQENRDLRIAVAHVDGADAMRRSTGSYRYPTIAAQPSVGRTREAQNRPNNGNTNGRAATYNDVQLPLSLSYEVDIWGRIRRQVQAANANLQASEEDMRFVQLTVTASVATDYFNIREADAESVIIAGVQKDLERGYQVTSDQFHKGIVSELPVKQAQSLLDQARAQQEVIHLRRDQAEHGLAVLNGVATEGFHVSPINTMPQMPVIPPGLPATMLNRRPDVNAAERRAAAASAQIGAAQAAMYPQFNLSALAGVESVDSTSLFAWHNVIASLAANAATPIFNGGRLRANVDLAQAQYREGLANYEKTVLSAYSDVEDQLAAVRYLSAQRLSLQSVVDSSRRAEQIASHRYEAGLVSYLDVVFAQQTLLQSEQALIQVRGQQATETVAVIRSLGGGW